MKRGNNEIPMNCGDEMDVFSEWRRVLCFTHRPGVCKNVKRQFNRRVRRNVKREIENQLIGGYDEF